MGAEATMSRRQRVLARGSLLLDLAPSGAYPTNSRRGAPRGFRGAPPMNYRPGRYVLFRPFDDGRRDDYGCLGFPRTGCRGLIVSPFGPPNDVAPPFTEVFI